MRLKRTPPKTAVGIKPTPQSKGTGGGAFGSDVVLDTRHPLQGIDLETIDLDTIGQRFSLVAATQEDEPEPEEAEPIDKRTADDLRREALALIVNRLDIPEGLDTVFSARLAENIDKLSQFLCSEVVPAVLAVSPAIDTLRAVVPKVLNDEDTAFEMESDLVSFAVRVGALRAKAFIVDDLLSLPADWKDAYFIRTRFKDEK